VNLPETFASHRPVVLDLSRAGDQARRDGENSVVLRNKRMKPATEAKELQALNQGLAVINVISTPWTVHARDIRVSLNQRSIL
jgi:hypothetical protein